MRLGIAEIALIVILAIALIKPEKLKEYMKSMRQAFSKVKEVRKEVDEEIAAEQQTMNASSDASATANHI